MKVETYWFLIAAKEKYVPKIIKQCNMRIILAFRFVLSYGQLVDRRIYDVFSTNSTIIQSLRSQIEGINTTMQLMTHKDNLRPYSLR